MPQVSVRRIVRQDELSLLIAPKDDFLVLETPVAQSSGEDARTGNSDEADLETETPPTQTSPPQTALSETPPAQTVEFTAAEGAFREYRRTVHVTTTQTAKTDSEFDTTETTAFRLSVPFWSFGLNFLVKRELRRQPELRHQPELPRQQPWWLPAQRLTERSGHVIGVLCLIALFTGYLGALLSQTITFVADEFNADKSTQGVVLSAVRLGAPLVFAVALLADRHGRKKMLSWGLLGAYVITAFTAASTGLWMFGVSQGVARGLTTATAVLIGIIAAEEMPAGSRAYAASVLSLCGALGAGVMVWLLPLADLGTQAWRIVYLAPLLAAPALIWTLRNLPETRRFEVAQTYSVRPALLERGRLIMLGVALFLMLMFITPASQFLNEYLRDERGFSGWQLTAYQLLTNTPAGISLYLAGRWSDNKGRRRIAMIALAGVAVFTFFRFATDSFALWSFGLLASIFAAALPPTIGLYGPELFSTTRRGGSNGILTICGIAGGAVGLFFIGQLSETWNFGQAFATLSFAPLVVIALVFYLFPETSQKELETLNPSDPEI